MDRKAAGDTWKGTEHGLVFTLKNGTPLEPRNLNRSFETLCVRSGIHKARFHDLRHTCASLLHEQGADARMIMEVLGHSSIRVTMDVYTFVRLGSQRSAFDRVGNALRGDGTPPDDDDGAAGALVTAWLSPISHWRRLPSKLPSTHTPEAPSISRRGL
ncbi:tyrosine-type recombinase/integrase [Streptomyces sp. x-19]|uniref:tyrosine-type recombinase/integrase n=1 Tax=Streptomyces sp. x-19 TaxID=2789280 RepID=UPI00397EAB77